MVIAILSFLQVGADGIARLNITHHAFFCKLTLCSSRHFAPVQHFVPHHNGIMCMLKVILHTSYNLSFLLQLALLNTTTKCHVQGSFCASGSLLNIIASSLPFCNLHLDMSCVSRSRLLKDCEYVGIKTHGTHLMDL
jgi:hypothetical protein